MDFATATAASPVGAGRFEATVHPNWTVGGKPNGGYLLATLARAAVAVDRHEHVIAASAYYLHSPDPGPVTVDAEVLRAGRSASQVRARMAQNATACVDATFLIGRFDSGGEAFWDDAAPRRGTAARAECPRVPGVNPSGVPVPIMDEVDLRIERETFGFARGRPSGRGELRGWLALPDDAPFDPISLLYAVDSFPPATFDIELTGWVPTLELTAYVRALPAPGPLQVLQKANLIDAQRVDEACWVWDSRGRIVAQATQLAGIRLG